MEMKFFWYAYKGDPHWDTSTLWCTMGHLYKTGLWIKKKSKSHSDEHITAAYMENGFKNAHGTYVNWKNTFAGDADVPADIATLSLQLVPNKMIIFIYLQQASMRMVDFMQLETVVTIGLLMHTYTQYILLRLQIL